MNLAKGDAAKRYAVKRYAMKPLKPLPLTLAEALKGGEE